MPLILVTCSWVEGPITKGLRDFRGSPRDSLTSRTSNREKHLDKFFKIFVLSVLATGPDNLLATWLSRENRVFCANRSVFKHFQFSLEHFWLFIVFPISNLSQTHRVTLKEPPFLHHFNSKSSKTRYGFSLSPYILHVLNLVYLNLWVVDLIWDIGCFGDGLDVCLLCLDFWVLLIRLLGFYFCFHGWYWLCVSIDPFGVWISYPLCYELFWYTVMHFMCIFGWFKMIVFRWLGYLFKLFMVILCSMMVCTLHTLYVISHSHMPYFG